MNAVSQDANFPTAIGLLEAVEDLGKVLNCEATGIEYYPTSQAEKFPYRKVVVNDRYISGVTANRRRRESPMESATELEGRLIAVDVAEGKFKLALRSGKSVSGTFTPMMQAHDRIPK